jgi:TonB-dependent receptor
MKKYLLSLILLPFTLLYAQEDTEKESEEYVEEITVTGIRSSLQNAIDIKRSNVGVMEAITAEDFGKFPDGNLAESLARVVGIGIDRSNVEGERVAVRGFGPEFNLVTLNGRQMPTVPGQWGGGRSFNFGDIASPGIAAVEVYKATNNTLPSGGIGSTINMVTTKPLNVNGTKRAFSINYVADTTAEDASSPIETSLLYATNKGSWGFSFSGSYQQRENREEGTRESNWLSHPQIIIADGYDRLSTATNVTNNSKRTDGVTFYQEPTAYQIKDNDRTRKNAQMTLQAQVDERIVTTLDITYSGVEFASIGQMFGSWLGGWDTQQATVNENGAYTDVVVGNRAYDHQLIWGETESDNLSVGFNVEFDVNDSLVLSLDFHNSYAEKSGTELPNEMGFTTDIQGTVTHTNGGVNGINTFSHDTVFTAANYLASNLYFRDAEKENEIDQFQISGSWTNQNDSYLKSIDFGFSSLDNEYTDIRKEEIIGAINPSAADFDDSIFTKKSLTGFMDAFNPNIGTDYYFEIDRAAAVAAFIANAGSFNAGGIDTNERVNEELDTAYLQLNFESAIGDKPLNVILGLRYEDAKNESISLEAKPSTVRWDMINGLEYVSAGIIDAPRYGDHDIVLPSVLASLALDEDQVVRFSYGRSMARPSLQDLRSQLAFGNINFLQATAVGGNPDLNPLISDNIDFSYENYYAEGSYFAVNIFSKKIKDFIGSRTYTGNVDGLTDPTQSAIGQAAIACVNEWVAAGRPQTGFPGDAGATGHCVSQQALWAQGWMNDFHHMGWVAVAMSRGVDVSNGFPWAGCGDYDGWWRCEPGYIDGQASDPLANFQITQPYNRETGKVKGYEVALQHFFDGTPYGMTFNATFISGGDVEVDRNAIGEQFILPGLGDSANLSFFYEDDVHTARIALNQRGETIAGFGNYQQPLYVEKRNQVDFSYQYRRNEKMTFFFDAMNITDETTRLYARHNEMLFLSQDHGPVYKFGFRTNF